MNESEMDLLFDKNGISINNFYSIQVDDYEKNSVKGLKNLNHKKQNIELQSYRNNNQQ